MYLTHEKVYFNNSCISFYLREFSYKFCFMICTSSKVTALRLYGWAWGWINCYCPKEKGMVAFRHRTILLHWRDAHNLIGFWGRTTSEMPITLIYHQELLPMKTLAWLGWLIFDANFALMVISALILRTNLGDDDMVVVWKSFLGALVKRD